MELLRNLWAALWLTRHWKELRQATRDMLFEDMCRIRKYRRFVEIPHA